MIKVYTSTQKPYKTVDDYIDEINMWCGVIKKINGTNSSEGLTKKELRARDNAIMALHQTMKEYMRKYS